jgi:hypothetical protein
MRAQVETLLLSEPNNQEYEDLYNSITEVRAAAACLLCVLAHVQQLLQRASLHRSDTDRHTAQYALCVQHRAHWRRLSRPPWACL